MMHAFEPHAHVFPEEAVNGPHQGCGCRTDSARESIVCVSPFISLCVLRYSLINRRTLPKKMCPELVRAYDTAYLKGKQVCEALQPLHPPVNVIPQKQKLPRCDVHPQLPHVVGEEVEVLIDSRERAYSTGGHLL